MTPVSWMVFPLQMIQQAVGGLQPQSEAIFQRLNLAGDRLSSIDRHSANMGERR